MDKVEARSILAGEMLRFRTMSHDDLRAMIGSPLVLRRDGPSGAAYQIEIEVFWDDPRQPGGDLRVLGSIDDGGFRSALVPLSSDFIKRLD